MKDLISLYHKDKLDQFLILDLSLTIWLWLGGDKHLLMDSGHDMLHDGLGDNSVRVDGRCALRDDSIESMDIVSSVVNGTNGTVSFDQGI